MLVLNFSHPIPPHQSDEIRSLMDVETLDIRTSPVQIDLNQPLDLQVISLVDACGLSRDQWRDTRFVVRSAGLAEAACAILAEIHGRSGYFPPIVVMQRDDAGLYQVRDCVDLQSMSEYAGASMSTDEAGERQDGHPLPDDLPHCVDYQSFDGMVYRFATTRGKWNMVSQERDEEMRDTLTSDGTVGRGGRVGGSMSMLIRRLTEETTDEEAEEAKEAEPRRATKEKFFEWFYMAADFGPSDSDVRSLMKQRFVEETGLLLPEGYDEEYDEEADEDTGTE